ncbi:MAG: phage portal protein [Phycisphaerae bacterium]|nr:phage portal protein [Phycisphaerae bacterium]
MAFDPTNFRDPNLDSEYVTYLVEQRGADATVHFGKLWDYFRNPIVPAVGLAANSLNANSRPYFQAQESGLPARITGIERLSAGGEKLTDLRRKEVVIENNIAWRIHTMIDFLFGKPVTIRSLAANAQLAEAIEKVVTVLLEANGGVGFLQEVALLGAVYGFVDIALRIPADLSALPLPAALRSADSATGATLSRSADRPGTSKSSPGAAGEGLPEKDGLTDPQGFRSKTDLNRAIALARVLQLETIEAPRVLPILEENDYRHIRFWVQKFYKHPSRLADSKRPWFTLGLGGRNSAAPAVVEVVEIISATWWQRYEDRQLVAEGPNSLGRLPIVHIQNIALPGAYEGLSDVEPLIPLQDELNTRLSDRAHRVTYQSFKMYLGKGIDDFLERPVGPGQMWSTQNPDASIEEFGSDSGSPSEDIHIEDVRRAFDKISGVPPLAAGLIQGSIGHLTSATALKVLLSGLLAKTAKKRLTYGAGLQQAIGLALDWLNLIGALKTSPEDRQIEVHWPNPLPTDESEQLRSAQIKAQLGISPERILAELGYDRQTASTG